MRMDTIIPNMMSLLVSPHYTQFPPVHQQSPVGSPVLDDLGAVNLVPIRGDPRYENLSPHRPLIPVAVS